MTVLSCNDSPAPRTATPVDLDLADAPALFEQDVRRSFEGSYHVAYDLELTTDDKTHHCTLNWWKDGTKRQRFDMCAPLVYGDDFDAEPWRILMFGDRDQTLVCSSRLPLDPHGELDSPGGGACHEDHAGIGDLAGNAVVYLGFPLEYPDALPAGYFDSLSEIKFEEVRSETVANRPARCYVIAASSEDPGPRTTKCFADDGAVVLKTDSAFFEYTLRATDVGPVTDADFDLPYPYVDANND